MDDLTTLVSLKSQEQTAHHYQTYETFRLVVDEALGGSSGSNSAPNEDEAIGSWEELSKAFEAIGGTVG